MPWEQAPLQELRNAFAGQQLALYLGAGVSVGSGLPTWDKLVLSMYYSTISLQTLGQRPYANYLYAIAEWRLARSREPLEVTARKTRMCYGDQQAFLRSLRRLLYAHAPDTEEPGYHRADPSALRAANPTLDAVARLCEADLGVRAVVNYNYDSLLEIALGYRPYRAMWRQAEPGPGELPIYHVHGYVPLHEPGGSEGEEIVFTEEQYHAAEQDAYSWANLVQIQLMSNCVGLMIGLSLTDRNMRRLLDATRKVPRRPRNFALLQRPRPQWPDSGDMQEINQRALSYYERFTHGGLQAVGHLEPGVKGPKREDQIREILNVVETLDQGQQESVLRELGVEPVWYNEHAEVPALLAAIGEQASRAGR